MKKVILLLFSLFLVTGCSVTNTVTINKDLSVKEELDMTGTSEYFNNYYKSRPINIINMMLDTGNRKETLINNGYSYVIKKESYYPSVLASKKYDTIDDYVSKTIFKEQYFNTFETYSNNNLITIKASDFIPYNPDNTEIYSITKFVYNLKVPYVVEKHNADNYDKKTNTYTWYIDKDTENKEIEITFDKDKVYVYNLVMYISMIILLILAIIVGIIVYKLVKKNQMNNQIND